MCRKHDQTVLNKGKHPKTEDQIKQDEANKINQKQKQGSKRQPSLTNPKRAICGLIKLCII